MTNKANRVRVLQVNFGRGRVTHDIAYAVAYERNVDVIVISEPSFPRHPDMSPIKIRM